MLDFIDGIRVKDEYRTLPMAYSTELVTGAVNNNDTQPIKMLIIGSKKLDSIFFTLLDLAIILPLVHLP